jgi:hypothetical protein
MINRLRERWQDSEYLPRIIVEIGGLLVALPVFLVWAFGDVGLLLVGGLMLVLLIGLILGLAQHNGV